MIAETFTNQRQEGDRLLDAAEKAVGSGDWNVAAAAHGNLADDLERHFGNEEQLLFPALEQVMGDSFGPTQVMRGEHAQLRALLADLSQAVAGHDDATYFSTADALRIMIRQHNLKEETVLYPIADRALAASRDALLAAVGQRAHAGQGSE